MALTKREQKLKQQRKRMREDKKITRDAAIICMNVLGVVPVYVLMEQYGWKRIRLSRFLKRYVKIMDDVNDRKISPEALADEIFHQTGIKHDNGHWTDTRARDGDD